MLVSPDWPCPKCGAITWNLTDDGRNCFICGHFEKETPLEEVCPGITAQILNARRMEEEGEDGPTED